ncbi:hypothetical protein WUBG_15941, partial [Wuchereria bancrofti]
MESSLERSLEMAAIHSDGLSDKERQVRAVKNTIRTHRRTASIPPSATCYQKTLKEKEDRLVASDKQITRDNEEACEQDDKLKKEVSDASAEESSEEQDENNGNILNSSLDSPSASYIVFRKFRNPQSTNDSERSSCLLITSSSTMESSLERSLEMAAIHSDGLSDKERQVRAVKNTIRTHRRTAS